MTTHRIGRVIGLALFSTLALAQTKQDPLEACYQEPDGAPRLACFNREMQRRQATGTTATVAAPVTPLPPAATADNAAKDTVSPQGSEPHEKLRAEKTAPERLKPIFATVVRMVPRSHNELAFVLDNGQTWEQAESMENLNVKLHDAVTIKPGILGAFFLSTPRSQRVRVHRIL